MKKLLLILIGIIIFVWGFVWLGSKYLASVNEMKIRSYVVLDVNPSVELVINGRNEIVEVISLNDEADIIISDLKLEKLQLKEAVEKVVKSAIDTGYIKALSDTNSLIVTTISNEEKDRLELEKEVVRDIDAFLKIQKVPAIVVAQGLNEELKAEAENYNISNGKMLLIDRAIQLNPELKTEVLVKQSISDIQEQIKNVVKERKEELKNNLKEQKQTKIEETTQEQQQQRDEIWEDNKENYDSVNSDNKDQVVDTIIEQKQNEIEEKVNNIETEIKQNQPSSTNTATPPDYPVIINPSPTLDVMISNYKKTIEEDARKIILAIKAQLNTRYINNTVSRPVVGDILPRLNEYGVNASNYIAAAIMNTNPLTISLKTKPSSIYGAFSVVATADSIIITLIQN